MSAVVSYEAESIQLLLHDKLKLSRTHSSRRADFFQTSPKRSWLVVLFYCLHVGKWSAHRQMCSFHSQATQDSLPKRIVHWSEPKCTNLCSELFVLWSSILFSPPKETKPNQFLFLKVEEKEKVGSLSVNLVCTWAAMSVPVCTHRQHYKPLPLPLSSSFYTSSTQAHPTRPVQLALLRPCTYFVFGEAQTGKSICDCAHIVICGEMLLPQFNIQLPFCTVVAYHVTDK